MLIPMRAIARIFVIYFIERIVSFRNEIFGARRIYPMAAASCPASRMCRTATCSNVTRRLCMQLVRYSSKAGLQFEKASTQFGENYLQRHRSLRRSSASHPDLNGSRVLKAKPKLCPPTLVTRLFVQCQGRHSETPVSGRRRPSLPC